MSNYAETFTAAVQQYQGWSDSELMAELEILALNVFSFMSCQLAYYADIYAPIAYMDALNHVMNDRISYASGAQF